MPVAGSRQILAPPVRVSVALRDAPFLHTISTNMEPVAAEEARADGADVAVGAETVHFALQGDRLGTQLAYEAAAAVAADEDRLTTEIEQFLDRLQQEIAGPAETGADSPLLNTAKVVSRGLPFGPMPELVFGMPPMFWAGAAVFSFIFVLMFSAYL